MKTLSNNSLSIPTFSVDDIKDENIVDKSVIEKLVKNMVLIKNGIYLKDIYDVKTFSGTLVKSANPTAIEINSFYISKYPITKKEWTSIMDYDSSKCNRQDENMPVSVDYEGCLRFIVELNRITGLKFDLPTSAQWDYAAHGGRANNFHLEDKTFAEIEEYAWIDMIFPIGLKAPNTIGLYDMFGNRKELCKKEKSDRGIAKGGRISSERIWQTNGYYHYEDYWSEENLNPDEAGFRLVCNDVDIKSLL